MPRFFVAATTVTSGSIRIEGADADHLARSLRARAGEHIIAVDDEGTEHGVLLTSVSPSMVEGSVEWSRPATGEPRLRIVVLQALVRDGMDDAVEVLAETGAAEIWPVITERTVPRLDERRAANRVDRWRSVVREAAGLAGRGWPPAVQPLRELGDAVAALPGSTQVIALTTDAPLALTAAHMEHGATVALVIGPEGGLGPWDLDILARAGGSRCHLGPRVLRTRLAGAVAVSLLLAAHGDLDDRVAVPADALDAVR